MDTITNAFSREFGELSVLWRELADRFFDAANEPPSASADGPKPLAFLIRSAAKVEQTFGGINAQLWDDPYEWTLPEAMGSREKVLAYFEEVDAARKEGFGRIRGDEDLTRDIWTPAGTMPLVRLILETAVSARSLADTARLFSSISEKTARDLS